jgi:hypothetical protein
LLLTGCPPAVPDEPDAGAGPPDAGANEADAGQPDAGPPVVEDAGEPGADGGAPDETRYGDVFQKSSHNSFQRDEVLLDQLLYHRVRSLELDIHRSGPSRPETAGEWYVFHEDNDADETKCDTLADCFEEMRAFARAIPAHEVVTVFVDLKDDFDADGHTPQDLDARIRAHFAPDEVFEPADLIACGASSLKDGAATCGLPTLSSLRGQFLFVLTGGAICGSGERLSVYLDDDAVARAAFIAPQVSSGCPPSALAARDEVVFHNLGFGDRSFADEIHDDGLLTRVFLLNGQTDWDATRAFGVHHLATDKVNLHRDTWATTLSGDGYPFRCRPDAGCALDDAEAGELLGVEVNSEDIFGTGDDFVFLHATPGDLDRTWSALVSTENSHVDEFAKGCLMARESTADNARYFAVCRPADNHPPRVQRRAQPGATTEEALLTFPRPESTAFLRLTLSQGGTCASGEASFDGVTYDEIDSACFDAPLSLQGFAASSHGDEIVRTLFAQPRRDDVERALAPADLTLDEIGTVRSSAAFIGAVP